MPSGLAYNGDQLRLYAAIGGGTVAVLDTNPGSRSYLQVVSSIIADKTSVDLLDYSSRLHRVFVSTGTGGEVEQPEDVGVRWAGSEQ